MAGLYKHKFKFLWNRKIFSKVDVHFPFPSVAYEISGYSTSLPTPGIVSLFKNSILWKIFIFHQCLCYFQFSVTTNKMAMNICFQILVMTYVFISFPLKMGYSLIFLNVDNFGLWHFEHYVHSGILYADASVLASNSFLYRQTVNLASSSVAGDSNLHSSI